MQIVIIFAALFTGLLVGSSLYNNDARSRFALKIITSLSFVVLAFVIIIEQKGDFRDPFCLSIIGALALAFLGDFGLGQYHLAHPINKLDKAHWQEIGFVFFTLSQIMYVSTFFRQFTFYPGYLLVPFFGLILMFYIVTRLKAFDKKRTALIMVYTFLLTFMMASTLSAAHSLGYNRLGLTLCVAGSLFAVSDFTLIFKYYYHKLVKLTTVVSCITYYAAQLLFACSLYFYIV
jgi:hypothetical protein